MHATAFFGRLAASRPESDFGATCLVAASGPHVTLYGKPGCHLCEQAETLLADVSRTQSLTVDRVNIESSPELFAEYRYRIPVIAVEDGQTLDWPTTAGRIRRAVAAATGTP